jgi:hypothetical protein
MPVLREFVLFENLDLIPASARVDRSAKSGDAAADDRNLPRVFY